MNGSQLLALGNSVCDRIAGLSDVDLFDVFNVDMTGSHYLRWNDMGRVERIAVMQRASGQKESERMLWHTRKLSPESLATMQQRDRAELHARIDAAYAADEAYELDVDDMMGFATAMVKAEVMHPSHLLNDEGELD
jgi:hypothetical protein